MAQQFDVHYVSTNSGITAGTQTMPLWKNIASNGCISILGFSVISGAAGTAVTELVLLETTGGTKNGTVGGAGSVGVALTPRAGTVTTAVVPPDTWVGLKFGAGTAGANSIVEIAYVKGY